MKTALVHVHKFSNVAIYPIRLVVRHIPCPRKKKTVKIVSGVVIMLSGAAMATHPLAIVPHFLWDAIAYGLHGYGALPILKILCAKFDLEHIEDEEKGTAKELAALKAEVARLEKLTHKE